MLLDRFRPVHVVSCRTIPSWLLPILPTTVASRACLSNCRNWCCASRGALSSPQPAGVCFTAVEYRPHTPNVRPLLLPVFLPSALKSRGILPHGRPWLTSALACLSKQALLYLSLYLSLARFMACCFAVTVACFVPSPSVSSPPVQEFPVVHGFLSFAAEPNLDLRRTPSPYLPRS